MAKTEARKQLERQALYNARLAVRDGKWSEKQLQGLLGVVDDLSTLTLLYWTRRGQTPLQLNATIAPHSCTATGDNNDSR